MNKISKTNSTIKQILKVLSYTKSFMDAMPSKTDTQISKVFKGIHFTSMALSNIDNYIANSFKDKYPTKTNQQFVDAFFNSPLNKPFKITKNKVDEYESIVVATNPELGNLYFKERKWASEVDYSPTFWHSVDFNFKDLLSELWGSYQEKIHVEFDEGKWGAVKAKYSSIEDDAPPMTGKAKEMLKDFIANHQEASKKKISRTYLLHGPPGTGKSTFALRFAQLINGRVMRLDANGMTATKTSDLEFILNNISPNVVIVDDIDRSSNLAKTLPTLFTTLITFKTKFPDVVFILTANNISNLNSALIRPGRVDEIKEFGTPDKDEADEILNHFLEVFNVTINDNERKQLIAKLLGLTPVYYKKAIEEMQYKDIKHVIEGLTTHKMAIGVKDAAEIEEEEKKKAAEELAKKTAEETTKSINSDSNKDGKAA